ncbi:MAG: AI-2E family transporter [Bdellovibrio sp.]|nr:AI-2E family transporter [Bdellovibrio sp.]
MGRIVFIFFVFGFFLYICSSLLVPVCMGTVFAILFFPLQEYLEKKKFPSLLAATLISSCVSLLGLLPFVLLILWGVQSGLEQLSHLNSNGTSIEQGGELIENLINSQGVQTLIERITSVFPLQHADLLTMIKKSALTIGLKSANILGNFVTQLPYWMMSIVIMVLSFYFFLLDGRKLIFFMYRHSFFNTNQTAVFMKNVAVMCRSVILAAVISGFVQSVVFTTTCMFAGVANFALIGFVIFLFSFIPLIGSMPVTFGIAIYQILVGNKVPGLVLLIMAIIVSVLDNLIRPVVLKGAGNLHPLLGFIAAFGGLQALGFTGIFLGPILAGIFISLIEILTQEQNS